MISGLLEFLVCRRRRASLVAPAKWRNDRKKPRAMRYLLGAPDPTGGRRRRSLKELPREVIAESWREVTRGGGHSQAWEPKCSLEAGAVEWSLVGQAWHGRGGAADLGYLTGGTWLVG